ncbi:MAG: S1C family serine protease [Quisquiliibacterium sp.]
MSDSEDWSFPADMRPEQSHLDFDLTARLDALVLLRAEVPEEAFTAPTLGTERGGNGVVIDDGLVLTIGYLITEAQTVWLTTQRGAAVQGFALAYDQATGFGLVRALGKLDATPMPRGRSTDVGIGDRVFMLSHGGSRHALKTRLTDRRVFAGYWEYLLEQAMFTSPAHPEWSGAAMVSEQGELVGIGSLLVQEAVDGRTEQGNMVVPIDLLEPILQSLLTTGGSGLPPRPWLGLYAGESDGNVVVGGVADNGPADRAGVQQGDLVLEVGGRRVNTLADMLRAVWSQGPAGTMIPVMVGREGDLLRMQIESLDRNALLAKPSMH